MTARRERVNNIRDVVTITDGGNRVLFFHVRESGVVVTTEGDRSTAIEIVWDDMQVLLETMRDKLPPNV